MTLQEMVSLINALSLYHTTVELLYLLPPKKEKIPYLNVTSFYHMAND
jgi:hypothetical protein